MRPFRLLILLASCSLLLASTLPAAPPAATAPDKPLFATPQSRDDLETIQSKLQDLIPKARAATVAVGCDYGFGSGVIISKDGYVLTAGHVTVKPNQDAYVILENGKTVPAKTLGVFATMDAGLVKIVLPGDYPFLPMGKSADLKAGQWLLTLGHAAGYHLRRPAVPRLGRALFIAGDLIGTDSPLVSGDSGGPLVDLDGNVVGINSRCGIPFIANVQVPVDIYRTYWDRLVKGDYWPESATTQPAMLDDSHTRAFSPEFAKDNFALHTLFSHIAADAAKATVQVSCDARPTILGAVVSPDGDILTKASELSGRITCRFPDGKSLAAHIAAQSPEYDLALLKVDAKNLPTVPWPDHAPATWPAPREGTWVATPGPNGRVIAVGIISILPRGIPPGHGLIGVELADSPNGPQIVQVVPDSPAKAAGLQAKDIVTAVGDKETPSMFALIRTIQSHNPGARVELTVHRGERTLKLTLTLVEQFGPQASTFNRLRGPVSKRATGFPTVLQHDCILKPVDCGGPLVDIDGKVIALNIARAGRADSFAIPAATVLQILDQFRNDANSATRPSN